VPSRVSVDSVYSRVSLSAMLMQGRGLVVRVRSDLSRTTGGDARVQGHTGTEGMQTGRARSEERWGYGPGRRCPAPADREIRRIPATVYGCQRNRHHAVPV
jgi:hypothetical protein